MTVLITGGCGFIGSAIIRRLIASGADVVNLDKLTYAATPEALDGLAETGRYRLVQGDIADAALVEALFEATTPDAVIHCAAESHVDRSIDGPAAFMHTNVTGTFQMLEAARTWWEGRTGQFRFLHISTDEVFGSLKPRDAAFTERHRYQPNSPYSASKAASDHLVRAWGETYGLPVLTTHCSNNYGPWQFPEKLIPLMTINALERRVLPVYGAGTQVRDWIHVEDHARAVEAVLASGKPGETYNIGGNSERRNMDVVRAICAEVDRKAPQGAPRDKWIRHVEDRLGHDQRYAIDCSKIQADLGWQPEVSFEEGLAGTIDWYIDNRRWWEQIRERRYAGQRLGVLPGAANRVGRPASDAVAAAS